MQVPWPKRDANEALPKQGLVKTEESAPATDVNPNPSTSEVLDEAVVSEEDEGDEGFIPDEDTIRWEEAEGTT